VTPRLLEDGDEPSSVRPHALSEASSDAGAQSSAQSPWRTSAVPLDRRGCSEPAVACRPSAAWSMKGSVTRVRSGAVAPGRKSHGIGLVFPPRVPSAARAQRTSTGAGLTEGRSRFAPSRSYFRNGRCRLFSAAFGFASRDKKTAACRLPLRSSPVGCGPIASGSSTTIEVAMGATRNTKGSRQWQPSAPSPRTKTAWA